ncbi:histidinol-phosphatase [Parasphingorhabdus sp. DH2-15]|uniref:histidinol-phosphatase n=1 Tax=Parasphingorhabdus sp. DH2-15 TaxID=3444112 RepID=UPI003F6831F2
MTKDDIALASRLADAAGAAIRPFFRAVFETERKGDSSPVTEADRAAEAAMRQILDAERPDDAIIGEEYGEKPGTSGKQWVLDPIDGTTSFIAGRPIFGTLIALLEGGFPVIGVIDQPIAKERWTGVMGRCTTFNGQPVKTRPCPKLDEAILASTSPHLFTDHDADHFMKLAKQTETRRMIWGGDCYNYGLLASGHIDLVCESGLKLHDFAALVPIVEGAGGHMCDWQGDPLHAASDGRVVAIGDSARVEDVLVAMGVG